MDRKEKQIQKEDIVIISSEAASMGGSQVFLQPLEQISVDDLIKCVCIASANDAMYALSELIATTNQNFETIIKLKILVKNKLQLDNLIVNLQRVPHVHGIERE